MFEIQSIKKTYNKKTVLEGISTRFSPGEFVALMGKNGSGKSTLMRLLAQQELVDGGDILFLEQSLRKSNTVINPFIAFISEDHQLPLSISLERWADHYASISRIYDRELLKRLRDDLEVDFSQNFHSLSRGQKAKALFCLLAARRPKAYILDEITSVLDPGSRWTLMEFLKREVSTNRLVIMSTNIASEMHGFATHTLFLEHGRPLFSARTDQLQDHFQAFRIPPALGETLGSGKFRRILKNSDGSWTYLMSKTDGEKFPPGALEERREITLADVQSYFTAKEGAKQ